MEALELTNLSRSYGDRPAVDGLCVVRRPSSPAGLISISRPAGAGVVYRTSAPHVLADSSTTLMAHLQVSGAGGGAPPPQRATSPRRPRPVLLAFALDQLASEHLAHGAARNWRGPQG